jgi:hypothetical protein
MKKKDLEHERSQAEQTGEGAAGEGSSPAGAGGLDRGLAGLGGRGDRGDGADRGVDRRRGRAAGGGAVVVDGVA